MPSDDVYDAHHSRIAPTSRSYHGRPARSTLEGKRRREVQIRSLDDEWATTTTTNGGDRGSVPRQGSRPKAGLVGARDKFNVHIHSKHYRENQFPVQTV